MARVLLGRPVYEVSAYFVDGTLIDSGCPATARELLAWAKRHPVERIVHTHHHEDHTGGSALLAEELGVPVIAPRSTAALLARFDRVPLYRRFAWGRPRPVRAIPADDEIEAGSMRLEVLATPGHAEDHHALFDRERGWVFSGDLYVHERVRYLRDVEDPWRQIESLRAIAALSPRALICAHAGVITEDPVGAIRRRIEFWEEIALRARRELAAGRSLRATTRALLGREGLLAAISLGDFSKRNLVRALVRGERVRSEDNAR